MNNLDSSLNQISQLENDNFSDKNIENAIKLRENNNFNKKIRFDNDVNKKLILMMTYWDIDHSDLVAKAINELYAHKFLNELNELKS